MARITPRAMQAGKLLAKGKRNREIAAEMGLSVRTVECYVGWLMAEYEVQSRTQLALKLLKQEEA